MLHNSASRPEDWPSLPLAAYAYPEPAGFSQAPVAPAAASYDAAFGELLLPYEAVRQAEAPDDLLLEFLQSTYEAAADLGGWARAELERA